MTSPSPRACRANRIDGTPLHTGVCVVDHGGQVIHQPTIPLSCFEKDADGLLTNLRRFIFQLRPDRGDRCTRTRSEVPDGSQISCLNLSIRIVQTRRRTSFVNDPQSCAMSPVDSVMMIRRSSPGRK